MDKPKLSGSMGGLLMVILVSGCVTFFPILHVNDDTTGGGGAAFLMCMTIPCGAGIFLIGFSSVIRTHRKSLKDYNKWKSIEYKDYESASAKLEEIFTSTLQGEDLDRAISSIPMRLEKFEGKWDELIVWAEEKHGPQ